MNSETQSTFVIDRAAESQNQLALDLLRANLNQWVAMPVLVEHCGGYAIHSRMADLRREGHQVENMVDRSEKPYKSWYRLLEGIQ